MLDTVNFSEVAGKTTARDEAACDWLQQHLCGVNKDVLFQQLQTAKSDISGTDYTLSISFSRLS